MFIFNKMLERLTYDKMNFHSNYFYCYCEEWAELPEQADFIMYLLEATEWPKGRQASSGVWRVDSGLLSRSHSVMSDSLLSLGLQGDLTSQS